MKTCFDRFTEYKKSGLEAYRAGNFMQARESLLKAAEYLSLLAQNSSESQKDSRRKNAEKLKKMALSIAPSSDPSEKVSTEQFKLTSVVPTRFDEIAGLEDVKKAIFTRMVYPVQYPELAGKYGIERGGGILLYGPPGTGKTMIARAVASEIQATMFTVKPSEIMSKMVGEAEKNIHELFLSARACSCSVIFIDELEALVPKRGNENSPVMQRLVPQILQELEGVEKTKENHLLFMGATNEPWCLDPAILRPGRFDELLYVPLPAEPARKAIFELSLQNKPIFHDVDFDLLAKKTDGYSGADIVGICRKTAAKIFRQAIQSGVEKPITLNELERMIDDTAPSVSPVQLASLKEFAGKGR